MSQPRPPHLERLRGIARLAVDGALGLTDVVEAMHARIARVPLVPRARRDGRTRGVTGLVYRSVRGTARLVGLACDAALARARSATEERAPRARAEAAIAALNGVVGDHLAASRNPLAFEMELRREGRPLVLERAALSGAIPDLRPRVLLLVHGLCMSERCWERGGARGSASLARALGATPLHLRYNSGLHVSTNGASLARLLEALVRAWPVPLERLTVVAHSMGGLVARSACHEAAAAGLEWPRRLDALVFLGTPHHGAPLERGGSWLQAILGAAPYTAPLARLGRLRSAGVTDLRHGSLLDDDWRGRDRFALRAPPPAPVPLPDGVRCFAVAGCAARSGALVGDGLVPVRSALGEHREPGRALAIPASRRWIAHGVGHTQLLGAPRVYARLRRWLAPATPRPPRTSPPAPSAASGRAARR